MLRGMLVLISNINPIETPIGYSCCSIREGNIQFPYFDDIIKMIVLMVTFFFKQFLCPISMFHPKHRYTKDAWVNIIHFDRNLF